MRRFWYVFAILVIAVGLLVGFVVKSMLLSPHNSASTTPVSSSTPVETTPHSMGDGQSQPQQQPGTLLIPAIGVNAPIEPVGKAAGGVMAVPVHRQWDGVGWYQYGPLPGQQGSAVIDGHLDRPGGLPAVFWNLKNLHVGDEIIEVNADKQTLHFRVQQMAAYQPANAPLRQIFENNSGKFLNLITCAGTWIPSIRQTTLRLVVYSVLTN